MKIVSWNVNGLKALQKTSSLKTILDSFNADIICMQETKLTRDTLDESVAAVPGYDSFFSTCRSNAYSGVVTYCKSGTCPVLDALDGLSGALPAWFGPQVRSRLWLSPNDNGSEYSSVNLDAVALEELDVEGRCVITDHGTFILFNVYFPRACPDEKVRFAYKTRFNKFIEARCRQFVNSGRHVVIAGDVNICHMPIDHCDPEKWEKETGVSFEGGVMRQWLKSLLVNGGGIMVDSFRHLHPNEKGAYTCWSTVTSARATNYGTRIDYVLISANLVGSCESAGLLPDVHGSDHCPVYCVLKGLPIVTYSNTNTAVPLCAKYMFNKRQSTLRQFMTCKRLDAADMNKTRVFCTESPVSGSDSILREAENGSRQRTVQSAAAHETLNRSSAAKESAVPQSDIVRKTKNMSVQRARSSSISGRARKESLTIRAFFSPKSHSEPSDASLTIENAQDCIAHQSTTTETSLVMGSYPIVPKSIESPTPNAIGTSLSDTRKRSHEERESLSTRQQSDTDGGRDSMAAVKKWRALLRGNVLPLCSGHGKHCVERVVKKEGVNNGRVFYCCALPQGHTTDPKSRCSFFIWQDDHERFLHEGHSPDYSKHPKYQYQRNRKQALPPT